MEYCLQFNDAKNRWAVIVDYEPEHIGHHYKFKPFKGTIVRDAYDEADFHYYERKTKDPIPEGTEVIVDNWWMNFYGSYFRINYNGHDYDVKTSNVILERLPKES